jgi:hypothetical protein
MSRFTKHFETTDASGWEIIRKLNRMLRFGNARKFGKHRRGTVRLVKVTGLRVAEGRHRFSLTFQTAGRFIYVLDPFTGQRVRYEAHGLIDFRPLLRRLSR